MVEDKTYLIFHHGLTKNTWMTTCVLCFLLILMLTSYNKITIFCTKTMQITKNPYLWDDFLVKFEKTLLFFTFYLWTCFQVSEFPTYFQAKIANHKEIVNVCKNCIKTFQITKNVALLHCLIMIMLKRKTFFVYFLPLLNIYRVVWFTNSILCAPLFIWQRCLIVYQ